MNGRGIKKKVFPRVIGFLLGVTAAGSAGYYYLLGEYNNASAALLISVQELQASTDKVKIGN